MRWGRDSKMRGMTSVALVFFITLLGVGCGTQTRAQAGATTAHIMPSPATVDLETPAGVAQAIAANASVRGMSDRIDAQALDTPAHVFLYSGHAGPEFTDRDHWVATVRDGSGRRSGLYDFEYIRSQHLLRFVTAGVITPQDPHSSAAFPWLRSTTAIERLHALRRLDPAAGVAPRMIYFPIDDRWRDPSSPISQWRGGGDSPMNPMWQIQATDGVIYFVGQDLKVYAYADLPIEPAFK